jgi:pilus assembly protein CpaD
MIRKNSIAASLLGGAAMLALGLSLQACSPAVEGYEPTPTIAKTPVVEWEVSRFDLRFTPGRATLAPGERERLISIMANEDQRRPIKVLARTNAPGAGAALAVDRAAALTDAFAEVGAVVEFVAPSEMVSGGIAISDPEVRDSAAVYLGQYQVSVPGCPDFRKPIVTDFTNTPSSNFGCATAMNLANMVADPGDLIDPGQLGDADGAREAMIINKYRVGKAPRVANPDLPSAKEVGGMTQN